MTCPAVTATVTATGRAMTERAAAVPDAPLTRNPARGQPAFSPARQTAPQINGD